MQTDDIEEPEIVNESSKTFPVSVGDIKKGDHCILKGHPCKIVEVHHIKLGKHGHTKAVLIGLDIFTSKRYEDSFPTSHTIEAPFIEKKEYQLLDVIENGEVKLLMK